MLCIQACLCTMKRQREIDRIIITRVAGKAEAVFGLLERSCKIIAQKKRKLMYMYMVPICATSDGAWVESVTGV